MLFMLYLCNILNYLIDTNLIIIYLKYGNWVQNKNIITLESLKKQLKKKNYSSQETYLNQCLDNDFIGFYCIYIKYIFIVKQ
jgi:hypothetical protein